MARPRGEVREALLVLFRQAGVAGITARCLFELLIAAGQAVTYLLVRRTVENMVRQGELESVGREKRAGSMHWERVYALRDAEAPADPLASVMRTFPAQAVEA